MYERKLENFNMPDDLSKNNVENDDLAKIERQEREFLEKISRREFLKKLAIGAAILGFGGIEAALSSGCAIRKTGLKTEEIHKRLERFNQDLEDPNEYLQYLEDREFIIKNEIFDSYARTVDKRPEWLNAPVGGYMSENYLDTEEERREFKERLTRLGLSQDEIKFYESFFTSADIIIFRESIIKEKFFLKALPHERFHRAIKQLNNEEYKAMKQIAQKIINKRDKEDMPVIKEKYYKGKTSFGFYTAAASMNWEEFYTYLAQGEFDVSAEEILKTDYPEIYEIFTRIKESCKIKLKDQKK